MADPVLPRARIDPDLTAAEVPLAPREELEEEEDLDGLTEEQPETFRRRAFPSRVP